MNTDSDNAIRLKLLRLLQNEPELTQREMNQKMGISLGKINYCISALSQQGMIKVHRFKKSTNKSVYLYCLTPLGVEEITVLTLDFLKIKIRDYDRIKMEIISLSEQIKAIDPELYDDEVLKKIS
jgi:EPS-associated MarR family transcriptional regulator